MMTQSAPTNTKRDSDDRMKIGELARRVDVDAATIRFYEAEGVLPTPERTAAGYRMYGEVDAGRLQFIKHARALGIGLAEIREVVVARDAGSPPCAYVRRLLQSQITETQQKLDQLAALLAELQRLEQLSRDLPRAPAQDEACICHAIECSTSEPQPIN